MRKKSCVKAILRKTTTAKSRSLDDDESCALVPDVVDDECGTHEMTVEKGDSGFDARNFSPEKISRSVAKCFRNLKKIREQVDKAVLTAEKARRKAINASQAETYKLFVWKNAKTLEELQSAMAEIAEVTGEQSKLIKRLTEYQTCVAEAIGFLLKLGVLGLAQNRMVVNRIRLELEHASKDELDAFARRELENCILQLKQSEEVQIRVERNAKGIEKNRLKGLERDRQIKENRERGLERDKKIELLNRQMRVVSGRHWGFYLFGVFSVVAFLMATAVFIKIFFFS